MPSSVWGIGESVLKEEVPTPETGRRRQEWTERAWRKALREGCAQRAGTRGPGMGCGAAQGRQEQQGFHAWKVPVQRNSESFSQAWRVGGMTSASGEWGDMKAYSSQDHHETHSRMHFDSHLGQALLSPRKANCCPWLPTPQAAQRPAPGRLAPPAGEPHTPRPGYAGLGLRKNGFEIRPRGRARLGVTLLPAERDPMAWVPRSSPVARHQGHVQFKKTAPSKSSGGRVCRWPQAVMSPG